MEPYTQDEIAWMRDLAKRVPVTDGSIERWLLTLDALQARLDAAEKGRDLLVRYAISGALDADPRAGDWTPRMQAAWDAVSDYFKGKPAPQAEAAPKAGAGEAVSHDRIVDAAVNAKRDGHERLCLDCLRGFSGPSRCPSCHPLLSPAMGVVEAKARAYDGVLAALKAGENAKMPFGQVMADLGLDSIEGVERICFATPLRAARAPATVGEAERLLAKARPVMFLECPDSSQMALLHEVKDEIDALLAHRAGRPA